MANVLIDGLRERIAHAIKINPSIGILLPGNNYSDLVQALFEHIKSKTDEAWVYVTVTKPYETLVREFGDITKNNNVKFIDCISKAAGMSQSNSNCTFIESPAMLEKLGLEIMNIFKEVDENTGKYLVIDSLTNLIIYNDPEIITEFFYQLINKARARDIHIISLAIEEEGIDSFLNKLVYLNDKILKVRDSFI
ncbi:MAG: hypothetical protein U9O49_03705 [Candidatus Thermoplasmatota archaeon]|nr:hypothetical protein [Candidatus Thermoplasmatota archaeon]